MLQSAERKDPAKQNLLNKIVRYVEAKAASREDQRKADHLTEVARLEQLEQPRRREDVKSGTKRKMPDQESCPRSLSSAMDYGRLGETGGRRARRQATPEWIPRQPQLISAYFSRTLPIHSSLSSFFSLAEAGFNPGASESGPRNQHDSGSASSSLLGVGEASMR